MLRLHLGCGKKYLDGYVHIDLADFPHIDYKSDIAKLPMFADNSVDLIYSSHALPYYDRVEVVDVLKEWNRVLKVGGTLRLAVSNFKVWIELYQQTGKIEILLGAIFGRWPVKGTNLVVYQKTAYDFRSLKQVLENAGFGNVHRWDWEQVFPLEYQDYCESFIPHINDCENMEEYRKGLQTSLNVECTKL